jgi:hypothetical protein
MDRRRRLTEAIAVTIREPKALRAVYLHGWVSMQFGVLL